MNFDDMQSAVNDARQTIYQADRVVADMAKIIAGRLQSGNVRCAELEKLKRELANYNMHTMMWKP
jgi:hypothetical protein